MFFRTFSFITLFFVSIASQTAQFKEGDQFTKIAEHKSSSPQVTEFFSYYCPICYRFEPLAEKIRATLPDNVAFVRSHVDFLPEGHAPTDIQTMMSKVLVVTEVLGEEQRMTPKIFDYIHDSHGVFSNIKDVRNLFVINDIDGKKFDALYTSADVQHRTDTMKQLQEKYAEEGILKGVPTIIVNEKYRINATELDRDNFEEEYLSLVAYLLSLE